jgi:hypothetical protein
MNEDDLSRSAAAAVKQAATDIPDASSKDDLLFALLAISVTERASISLLTP